jgi:hypothetical protein
MPYVVQAVGVPQGPFWLTREHGLSKRKADAETFTTRLDAQNGLLAVNRAERLCTKSRPCTKTRLPKRVCTKSRDQRDGSLQ